MHARSVHALLNERREVLFGALKDSPKALGAGAEVSICATSWAVRKLVGIGPILCRRSRFMRARRWIRRTLDPGKARRSVSRRRPTPCTWHTVTLGPPPYARIVITLLIGYVFSPMDHIPDFISVVGLLDEMVVVPLGVILARKMIPGEVLAECREIISEGKKPVSRAAAVVVVAVWLLLVAISVFLAFRVVQGCCT